MEQLLQNIATIGWYPPKVSADDLPVDYLEWSKDPRVQEAVAKRWHSALNRRKIIKNAPRDRDIYRTNIRREKDGIHIMIGYQDMGWVFYDNKVSLTAILRGSAWEDTEYNETNNIPELPVDSEDDRDCCGNHSG